MCHYHRKYYLTSLELVWRMVAQSTIRHTIWRQSECDVYWWRPPYVTRYGDVWWLRTPYVTLRHAPPLRLFRLFLWTFLWPHLFGNICSCQISHSFQQKSQSLLKGRASAKKTCHRDTKRDHENFGKIHRPTKMAVISPVVSSICPPVAIQLCKVFCRSEPTKISWYFLTMKRVQNLRIKWIKFPAF